MKTPIRYTAAALTLISTNVSAAGFALMEQSVSGLGRAFSGSAVVAEDATTIFFNPAGLSYLQHSELTAGLHYIAPRVEYNGDSTFTPLSSSISGGDGGDAANNAFVPNFYYAHRINDKYTAGIGVNSPYGLVTDYADDWKGRYQALESNLRTININPSLAFKANDKLSLGFGINLQYIDLKLSKAIDFGSACFLAGAGSCASPTNPALDGKAKLNADDWSWGYNLGLIYQFDEKTRAGISYRSKISHHLKGDGDVVIPNRPDVQAVAAGAGIKNGDIDGKVTLPESVSVALLHQINDEWAVMGDVSWTRWSRFQELRINSDDAAALNSVKEENWENSMRYGLGLSYSPAGNWSYRAGVAYDETPIKSADYRTPRIADADRIWLSLGTSYAFRDNLIVDAAYTHIFAKDAKINDVEGSYALQGEYESQVDIMSIQLRWLMD